MNNSFWLWMTIVQRRASPTAGLVTLNKMLIQNYRIILSCPQLVSPSLYDVNSLLCHKTTYTANIPDMLVDFLAVKIQFRRALYTLCCVRLVNSS